MKQSVAIILCISLFLAGYGYTYTSAVVEQSCPVCQNTFKATLDTSGFQCGMRLDLKPLGMVAAPMSVAVCPKCHFVIFSDDMDDEELAKCRLIVASEEYKSLSNRASYYLMGFLFEKLEKSPFLIAHTYLKASWQEETDPDRHAEDLKKSLEYFQAYHSTAEEEDDAWRTSQIVAGEIERRLGRFEDARDRFEKLKKMEAFQGNFLEKVVAFELELIGKKDTAPHAVSEIEQKQQSPD
jgi:uncharacterized protein (DUF2225 family)